MLALLSIAGCGGNGESAPAPAPPSTAAETTPSEPAPGSDSGAAEEPSLPPVGDGRGGVKLTELASFDAPLYVTQPPGESKDLYVVEQGGTVQRLTPDGKSSTFLDLSGEISSGGERGLLSIAFSPGYRRDGLLYADYTDSDGDTRVVELSAKRDGVDLASERELLRVDQPFANHNGGLLLFGPDDKLYIGLGDGGSGGDPERNGLDRSTLLGKILRIDPRPDGKRPYTVPADNPFTGGGDARGEVYSYGLRNPWRFSFDSESGYMTIGDVGQDSQEEIDVVARGKASGADFGWSAFEGDERFNTDQEAPDAVPPALIATHGDGNCSITGGLIVRDRDLESLYGRYVWGDLCIGDLRSFTPNPGRGTSDDVALGENVESLASFGTDNADNVYAISIAGGVYRLDPAR